MKKILLFLILTGSAFAQITKLSYTITYSSTPSAHASIAPTAGQRVFGKLSGSDLRANDSTIQTGVIMTQAGTFTNFIAHKTAASGGSMVVGLRVNARSSTTFTLYDSVVSPTVVYRNTSKLAVSAGDTVHVFGIAYSANQNIAWQVDFTPR